MTPPLLFLHRQILLDDATNGELLIRGSHFAWTLEDPVRETVGPGGAWIWRPEFKIPGRTAIPSGLYEVAVTWSDKFGRRMPLIMGVPDFSGIRMHGGKSVANSEGCPLIGRERDIETGRLSNFTDLVGELNAIIGTAAKKGKVWIRVSNLEGPPPTP